MPAARSLHAKALLVDSPVNDVALVRSSRHGITFHAGSHGFVAAGTVLSSQLAAVRVKFLGLEDWVEAKAIEAGMATRLSRPGQHSKFVSDRVGGRPKLADLISGPFLPVLKEFVSPEAPESTREAFPHGDGVVVGGRLRLLQFQAISRLTPGLAWPERRRWIDEMMTARLIRQGLVLDCVECGTVTFVSMNLIGQTYPCTRCEASNVFELARWKGQTQEPPWFYDLHVGVRELVGGHGDVGVLAAAFLRGTSRTYSDTAELEFWGLESHARAFELDLVSHVDGRVVVVEAKSNGAMGSGRARRSMIEKKFEGALVLRADRVAFATTNERWTQADINLAGSIRDAQYPDLELQWIAGLGASPSSELS